MFLKILKKDLKRKKAMNIILFLFMIIASMLIASSVNMLYTSTTALDHFKKVSNMADNIVAAHSNEKNDSLMKEWAKSNSKIKSLYCDEMIFITAADIIFPPQYDKLTDDQTLCLSKMPAKYNLVFNEYDEAFKLEKGEIALPISFKAKYAIKPGDQVTINIDNHVKKLTVKNYVKDVLFGSDLMGFKRIILSDKDYEDYYNTKGIITFKLWSIIKSGNTDPEDIDKDLSKTQIDSISTLNSKVVSYTYIMDLISAAIMIIVSIFLILISFLILRFTIVFTVEEDYKEIGVMKAIGLMNIGIKGIYMIKYLALSVVGGILGFIASIPFSKYLLNSISEHIMMKATFINYVLSLISVLLIVLVTIGFCYLCTRKINKLSAIEAIRQGSTGERFSVSKKLRLHKLNYLTTSVYLALSDLVSGFKRFIILVITFIFGTIIIIIPINIINTLNSNDIDYLFGMGDADFNIGSNSFAVKYMNKDIDVLLRDLNEIGRKAEQNGVKMSIYPQLSFISKIYSSNPDEVKSVLSFKAVNNSPENYKYLSGTPPKLKNEIAMTTVAAEYFGIGVGDTVYCTIQNHTDKFIITALYQTLNNLGFSVRFSEQYQIGMDKVNGFLFYGKLYGNDNEKKQDIDVLKKQFPELDIESTSENIEDMMGSVLVQLELIKNIILVIVLGINFLITSLLVRMLITREIPEIAVLKSIGFKDNEIRKWQAARIIILLLFSVILGATIANLTGGFITSGIFKFMGATQINLVIRPLQVYFVYPLIILVITMSAVLTSLGRVRRTNIWEINNQD